jgi:ribosomal protein S18 acetylase RimI-like enzyme
MEILKVQTRAELRAFIELPYQLYRNDQVWVPPLRSEQWSQFDLNRNPMLQHCEYALFLAKKDGLMVGRVSAFIDHMALDAWKQPIGLFGSYECLDDVEVSQALLSAARQWLEQKGMQTMRGPWSFASQEWGTVIEGFTPSPVVLAPYNPPFYNDQLTTFGFKKAKDLLVYFIDAQDGYQIPERYLTLTDKIKAKYGVRVRCVDMHNLEKDVLQLVKLANESISDNWGYYPVTDAEAHAMARDMKAIVHPKALLLAEDSTGRPIGFAMSLPDINTLLKDMNGNLFPLGWIKLLTGLPKIKAYRMWALGVIPEYQGKAIDTLLYRATYEAIFNDQLRLEINYVLEDNDRMNNALLKLGAKPLRRYRVYEKKIE